MKELNSILLVWCLTGIVLAAEQHCIFGDLKRNIPKSNLQTEILTLKESTILP